MDVMSAVAASLRQITKDTKKKIKKDKKKSQEKDDADEEEGDAEQSLKAGVSLNSEEAIEEGGEPIKKKKKKRKASQHPFSPLLLLAGWPTDCSSLTHTFLIFLDGGRRGRDGDTCCRRRVG
jgi:hypothetical protein